MQYGTPIVTFSRYFGGLNYTTNTLVSLSNGKLSDPNTTTVDGRANVDTVYSTAIFDLAAEDVVLTVPRVEPDRFYLFAFFDM